MSYVDAFYDRDQDTIHVVERDGKGQRQYKDHPARHLFYYIDSRGKYKINLRGPTIKGNL